MGVHVDTTRHHHTAGEIDAFFNLVALAWRRHNAGFTQIKRAHFAVDAMGRIEDAPAAQFYEVLGRHPLSPRR